jgi:hypothetical protein
MVSGEVFILISHLIIVPQGRAQEALPKRLQHNDVLTMRHDDARVVLAELLSAIEGPVKLSEHLEGDGPTFLTPRLST